MGELESYINMFRTAVENSDKEFLIKHIDMIEEVVKKYEILKLDVEPLRYIHAAAKLEAEAVKDAQEVVSCV